MSKKKNKTLDPLYKLYNSPFTILTLWVSGLIKGIVPFALIL